MSPSKNSGTALLCASLANRPTNKGKEYNPSQQATQTVSMIKNGCSVSANTASHQTSSVSTMTINTFVIHTQKRKQPLARVRLILTKQNVGHPKKSPAHVTAAKIPTKRSKTKRANNKQLSPKDAKDNHGQSKQ